MTHVFLQNLQLMTSNELATEEGLDSLTSSIVKNIEALATPIYVNPIVSCTYNMKQQYQHSWNMTGIQQVRKLIDLIFTTLATNNSSGIDTHIEVGDFKAI